MIEGLGATPGRRLHGPDAEAFYAHAMGTGLRTLRTPQHVDHRCTQLFAGVPLAGREVLDIGAGLGIFSAWAGLNGASAVLALEPELDGASRGFAEGLRETARRLRLPRFEVADEVFQTWSPGARQFDVVLMSAVVNHLDETACQALPGAPEARRSYRDIFGKVFELLRPGGDFIVTDASSRNWFGDRGLPAPLARSIEWDKHQPPEVWIELMHEVGFVGGRVDWYVHYALRGLAPVVSHASVAYALSSLFRIVVQKPG